MISNVDDKLAEIVNLTDTKRMIYDKVLVKIEDNKKWKISKELLKDKYKRLLATLKIRIKYIRDIN